METDLTSFGFTPTTEQGRIKRRATMAEQTTQKQETTDWEVSGWLNWSKTGKAVTVRVNDELIGVVSKQQMERLMKGEIKGVPIKKPLKE